MTRCVRFIGAVGIAVIVSTARSNAHPTGAVFGPVYRPAPVFVSPSSPERAARETLRVPLANVRTPSFPEARYPGSWRPWALRPGFQWFPVSPACVANAGGWTQPAVQTTWADELTAPGFTIGSLAGDPAHSIFASSPSYDAAIASSSANPGLGSTAISFQGGLQPTPCNGSDFAAE